MSQFPDTHTSLLRQLGSRDNREAWERFVLLYQPVIYRMARKRGMQDADAQDVTQSVLVRVAGAIERWEKQSPEIGFRHWLSRVAKNAIVNELSKRRADAPAGGTWNLEALDVQVHPENPIDEELASEFQRELFRRAAAIVRTDVNTVTWRAFELSVVDGKSCEDVASFLGVSLGSVYAARSRVMRRLKDQVERLKADEL